MYVLVYQRTLYGNNLLNDVVPLEPLIRLAERYETFEEARSQLHAQLNEMNPYEKPSFIFHYSIEAGDTIDDKELLIHATLFKEPPDDMAVNLKKVIEIYEELFIYEE